MDADAVSQALRARRSAHAVRSRIQHSGGVLGRFTESESRAGIRALLEETFAEDAFLALPLAAEREKNIGPLVANLTAGDVTWLIRTLLPELADSVVGTWSTLARRPYQQGGFRKPFRCPNSPATLAQVRGRWLLNTASLLGEYDGDIRWVAAWAPHLANWWGGPDLGWLLAGAIDAGGPESDDVLDILKASAAGEHEIGQMGRHVTQALLSCNRPDAWEYSVKLLLAAQRQEGLRQIVLESVDEAHPHAFRRMLQVIRAENLARFSATVRALDVWFGFMWDGASAIKVNDVIDRVLLFLDDPGARAAALEERDAETVYLALWSAAFDDVEAAIPLAVPLLTAPQADRRFVGAHFLAQTTWTTAFPPLVDALGDRDLRVAARALDACAIDLTGIVEGPRLFDALEGLMARLPKRTHPVSALVWPWTGGKLEKPRVAAAMAENASAVPVERLLPYVRDLDASGRAAFLRARTGVPQRWDRRPAESPRPPLAPAIRAIVLDALGDASPDVRQVAFTALEGCPVLPDEVAILTDLLGRKPGDLRTGCLGRLRQLPGNDVLSVADVLMGDASDDRRVAGLELLRAEAESGHHAEAAVDRIRRYASARGLLSEAERLHVDAVLGRQQAATRDNALGLLEPSAVRRWEPATPKPIRLHTVGAAASIEALAALVVAHEHVEVDTRWGERKLLLQAGSSYHRVSVSAAGGEESEHPFPLAATWKAWAQTREPALRDDDGLELLRALVAERGSATWSGPHVRRLIGEQTWSEGEHFLHTLLEWCVYWQRPKQGIGFLLDGLESSLANLTDKDFAGLAKHAADTRSIYAGERWPVAASGDLQKQTDPPEWYDRAMWYASRLPGEWAADETARLYRLLRWFQSRSDGCDTLHIPLTLAAAACREGVADDADFVDLLLGRWNGQQGLRLLREVSGRKPPPELSGQPALLAAVERCRRRVVEVECQRGDRPTAATEAALNLRWSGGLDTLSQALPALGAAGFARTTSWLGSGSKQETLSHLVLRSTPRPEDTRDAFTAWARRAKISDKRLIELAVYAPQWAGHVEPSAWVGQARERRLVAPGAHEGRPQLVAQGDKGDLDSGNERAHSTVRERSYRGCGGRAVVPRRLRSAGPGPMGSPRPSREVRREQRRAHACAAFCSGDGRSGER